MPSTIASVNEAHVAALGDSLWIDNVRVAPSPARVVPLGARILGVACFEHQILALLAHELVVLSSYGHVEHRHPLAGRGLDLTTVDPHGAVLTTAGLQRWDGHALADPFPVDSAHCIAVAQDGRLAVGDTDGRLHLFDYDDAPRGEPIKLEGKGPIAAIHAPYPSIGGTRWYVARDRRLHELRWDGTAHREVAVFGAPITGLRVCNAGKQAMVATGTRVHLGGLADWSTVAEADFDCPITGLDAAIASYLAVGFADAAQWLTTSWKAKIIAMDPPDGSVPVPFGTLTADHDALRNLAALPEDDGPPPPAPPSAPKGPQPDARAVIQGAFGIPTHTLHARPNLDVLTFPTRQGHWRHVSAGLSKAGLGEIQIVTPSPEVGPDWFADLARDSTDGVWTSGPHRFVAHRFERLRRRRTWVQLTPLILVHPNEHALIHKLSARGTAELLAEAFGLVSDPHRPDHPELQAKLARPDAPPALNGVDPALEGAFDAVRETRGDDIEHLRPVHDDWIPALVAVYPWLDTWAQRLAFWHLICDSQDPRLRPIWLHLCTIPGPVTTMGAEGGMLEGVVACLGGSGTWKSPAGLVHTARALGK